MLITSRTRQRLRRTPVLATDGRCDTLPKLLIHNVGVIGERPAMRHKDFGIWQTWTWRQMFEEVRAFSIGLAELGLKRGDKFAIVGSNRPRLYWAICAGQALGAVPVPVYADAVPQEMAYVLAHAEVIFGVVEDQEKLTRSSRSPIGCRSSLGSSMMSHAV